MNRREFMQTSSAAMIATLMPEPGRAAGAAPAPIPLMGNRFATMCIMIRVTPWEVSRDVKLLKTDETPIHTLKAVRQLSEAYRQHNPEGRLTWGFTMNALEDSRKNYREIRDYTVQCQREHGDEIAYFPGYFTAMYLPRARINRETTEALQIIGEMVGNGYRSKSVIGGFLSADNMKYLSEKENIHVAHGVIWSQHAIDGGGADGSPSYPYYPSTEHFCKPAQGKDDFIDCVNLDGWTMDFICARRSGMGGHGADQFNSRRGIGPIETYGGLGMEVGHRQVMHTESVHFDGGFESNGFAWVTDIWEAAPTNIRTKCGPRFAWVTDIWEAALVGQYMKHGLEKDYMAKAMAKWVGGTKERWSDVRFMGFGEFGEIWRRHYANNNDWNYRFTARGSGIADSLDNLEIRWFMNREFRLALLRDWRLNSPELVIDFTRYDLKAQEHPDAAPDNPKKDWSLMNRINQKGLRPQDKPVPLPELPKEDLAFIEKHDAALL